MSKFDKLYSAIAQGKTILGIGPMSFHTIDATIEIANANKIPIILIASRRQVECFDLGGGYVTDTKTFAEYTKNKNQDGYIFLARDHGGPWQGTDEQELDHRFAIDKCLKSYYEDIRNGFDIIHIDPSLKSRPIEQIIEDAIFLYNECEKYAKELGKNILYQVSFEKHSQQLSDVVLFEKCLQQLQQLEKIIFIGGNCGLYVFETQNTELIDERVFASLLSVCKKYNKIYTQHNCDYLKQKHFNMFKKYQVPIINIAPQYGYIETKLFLQYLKCNNLMEKYNNFVLFCERSNLWMKWTNRDLSGEEKTLICGHYNFKKDLFLQKEYECFFMNDLLIKQNILEDLNKLGYEI